VKGKLCILAYRVIGIIIIAWLIPVSGMCAEKRSSIDATIINFISDYYGKKTDIKISLTNQPSILKEGDVKVKNITFARLPDTNGNGICALEVVDTRKMTRNVFVPFKIMEKKRIYVLKENLKRGEILTEDKLAYKDIILREDRRDYPEDLEDIVGKRLKRDLSANSVITKNVLEDHFVIKRNDIVSIVLENKKFMVKAKGRALDKGRIGDVIRVKNLTSHREIAGRVVADSIVTVDM